MFSTSPLKIIAIKFLKKYLKIKCPCQNIFVHGPRKEENDNNSFFALHFAYCAIIWMMQNRGPNKRANKR